MSPPQNQGTMPRIERIIAATLCGVCLGAPLAFLAVQVYKDLDLEAEVTGRQGIVVKSLDLRPLKIKNLKKPFKIKVAKKLKVDRKDTNLIVVDVFKRITNVSADRIPVHRTQTRGLQPRDPFGSHILSKSELGEN